MTTDPRNQQSEQGLEQNLEKVRSAWSKLESAEPPELLDQAVLNTARRELESKPRRRSLHWLGAFATATVIVLALTVVIQQDRPVPMPAKQEANGIKLDQAAPVGVKKEADRDAVEQKAGRENLDRQLRLESGQVGEARMKRSVPPAAAPVSEPQEADEPALMKASEIEFEETATSSMPAESADTMSLNEEMADSVSEAEAWIERLLLLKETQQDEKLVEELAAFRETWPDYPLPPELED